MLACLVGLTLTVSPARLRRRLVDSLLVEHLTTQYCGQSALDPLAAAQSLTAQSPQVQEHAHKCMEQFA